MSDAAFCRSESSFVLLARKLLHPLAVHLRHVERAAGIEGHEVGELQGVGGAPTGGDAAVFEAEVKDFVDVSFAGEQLFANDDHAEGVAKTVPGGEVFSLGVEELDSLVAAVADVEAILRVDGE